MANLPEFQAYQTSVKLNQVSYQGARWKCISIEGFCYFHTFSWPMEDETLTILGEFDNWRRGMSASAVLLAP